MTTNSSQDSDRYQELLEYWKTLLLLRKNGIKDFTAEETTLLNHEPRHVLDLERSKD